MGDIDILINNAGISHMGLFTDMKPEECIVTDSAVDKIIEMYRNFSGCRDLEQAAEHIAGNALFRIETTGSGSVTYDTDDVTKLLG